ncbi:MAG: sugar ABC transporter substrate-binding protein [Chloroflexi bacterium]|nr:sugar ABC transporter substrate-binding protein [Chloroflexota bacterium]
MSRREALALVGKLGVGGAAMAAALSAGDITAARAASREDVSLHHKYRFVFVNHVTTNPFFTATQYGATDACQLLGCSYQWTGSQTAITAEMTGAMMTAINSRADGIAVCIVDKSAFNAPTNLALAKGIPVIAYNADGAPGDGNKRLAYVGQDLFGSGQAMGARIVQALPNGGRVALFIATPGQLNIQPRIDGARDVLQKSGKHYTIDVIPTGALVAKEEGVVESYYLGHRDVKGMFAVDAGSTQSIVLTSKKHALQRTGKVATGGFDLVPITVQGILNGDLGFTIDQQPYLQGFLPVVYLWLYRFSGTLIFPPETNTGLKFVTKANVRPYLNKGRFNP